MKNILSHFNVLCVDTSKRVSDLFSNKIIFGKFYHPPDEPYRVHNMNYPHYEWIYTQPGVEVLDHCYEASQRDEDEDDSDEYDY
jgi:hypothetical protein